MIGSSAISPVAIAQPIIGGRAPAAPPITMYWEDFLFNQIVKTKT